MLSKFVIAFLPRSKCLLVSWLQSPSAVILDPKEIKSVTVSIVSPSICHEVMGPDAIIFIFSMLSFKPVFFTVLFHLQQEVIYFFFTFCYKGGISVILRLFVFLPETLIPACTSSSPAFLTMYSAYN